MLGYRPAPIMALSKGILLELLLDVLSLQLEEVRNLRGKGTLREVQRIHWQYPSLVVVEQLTELILHPLQLLQRHRAEKVLVAKVAFRMRLATFSVGFNGVVHQEVVTPHIAGHLPLDLVHPALLAQGSIEGRLKGQGRRR